MNDDNIAITMREWSCIQPVSFVHLVVGIRSFCHSCSFVLLFGWIRNGKRWPTKKKTNLQKQSRISHTHTHKQKTFRKLFGSHSSSSYKSTLPRNTISLFGESVLQSVRRKRIEVVKHMHKIHYATCLGTVIVHHLNINSNCVRYNQCAANERVMLYDE